MKNTIKIKGLEKALEQVQIRASARTLTASKVYDNLNDVQEELERGKTVWKLLRVTRDKGIPADARIHNIKEFKEQIAEKLHDRMQRILID